MGFFIFAAILLIIAGIIYLVKDNKEQKLFEELTGQNKTSKEKPEEEQQEPEEPIEPEEPKTDYREPNLKSDPEIQKWLYVYDSMEQLKRENSQLKDELKEVHSKLTLIWVLALIVIAFYVLIFITLGSAGLTLIGLFQALIKLIQ